MKMKLLTMVFLLMAAVYTCAQEIPVRWEQDGSNIVILYDLPGNPAEAYSIVVTCSEDGGVTYGQPLRSLSGDAGPGIRPGLNKKINWDVFSDREVLEGNLKFRVNATQENSLGRVTPGTDEFTDPRDDKVYKFVRVGEQVWMAVNLNYNTSGASWCYNDKTANCEVYGMLYDWQSAISACPEGWHLPSEEEWDVLIEFSGGKKVAGGNLKETGYAHWAAPNQGAKNRFAFNALPGGLKDMYVKPAPPGMAVSQKEKSFDRIGKSATFWTSSKAGGKSARYIEILYDEEKCYHETQSVKSGLSIRCLKN